MINAVAKKIGFEYQKRGDGINFLCLLIDEEEKMVRINPFKYPHLDLPDVTSDYVKKLVVAEALRPNRLQLNRAFDLNSLCRKKGVTRDNLHTCPECLEFLKTWSTFRLVQYI